MRELLPVALIALLILTSGCIGGREVKIDANNGLLITEFTADPLTVEYSDPVLFFVDVENVGGTTASNINIILYGIKGV